MENEEVFLVAESWLVPGMFARFKRFRVKAIDALLSFGAEYAYHGHPFEWVIGEEDDLPTGIEVFHFSNELQARSAAKSLVELLDDPDAKASVRKSRVYLSRHRASTGLKQPE
jgi:uncharacterized protein (DUF1330 family)